VDVHLDLDRFHSACCVDGCTRSLKAFLLRGCHVTALPTSPWDCKEDLGLWILAISRKVDTFKWIPRAWSPSTPPNLSSNVRTLQSHVDAPVTLLNAVERSAASTRLAISAGINYRHPSEIFRGASVVSEITLAT
jgi:hypothetical protein